jgi:gas vesicle protein
VGGYLAGFLAGALIGAGLALIYAPYSGRETRDLLAQRTREAKDRVGDAVQSTRETVGGALHDAREKVGTALQGARDAIVEKKTEIVAAVAAGREAMREQKANPSNPV